MTRTRRWTQIITLLLFVVLFLYTEYHGQDILLVPVNIFLELDPLILLGTSLAARAQIMPLFGALVLLLFTALLGRFFCGWLCPLGTIFDIVSRKQQPNNSVHQLQKFKYLILCFLLVSALWGTQLIFLFDPISILVRSLTMVFYPAFEHVIRSIVNGLYTTPLAVVSEPIFAAIKEPLLSFTQPYYRLGLTTATCFLAILALEKITPRFWCRNLCPLGALLGICSQKGAITYQRSAACNSCQVCTEKCKTGAITASGAVDKRECILCGNCVGSCQLEAVSFALAPQAAATSIDLTRRQLLKSLGAAAMLAPVIQVSRWKEPRAASVIRPPGANLDDEKFLALCTRCGECMKVCLGNALHPTLLESGLTGIWSPHLVPDLGYCEYNCNLCGQVCPTGAIAYLPLAEKQQLLIGTAYIDKNRCIPYRLNSNCIVCEEHCPIPHKAIQFERRVIQTASGPYELLLPIVVEERCIGCGICQTKCPLTGSPGVVVQKKLPGLARTRIPS